MEIPTTPIVTPRRQGGGFMTMVLALAGLIAVAGVAFAVGRLTAPATTAALSGAATGATGGSGTGRGQFGGGGNGAGGGAGAFGLGRAAGAGFTVSGQVVAITADHLSLKLASGATIDIPISSATTYHAQSNAKPTDVKSGSQVLIRLQGGPGGGGGFGGPGASGAPSPGSSPAAPSPGASGAPTRSLGTATDITIVAP